MHSTGDYMVEEIARLRLHVWNYMYFSNRFSCSPDSPWLDGDHMASLEELSAVHKAKDKEKWNILDNLVDVS